ncbi:hypothetical protein [Hymenobacter sp. AT01-02]|uniref:hypothetical protein n=1 Tax=Hymenobacter sp. AT01-02 TaxID=1571877 RepID=UPI000AA80F87|nr:hypothetical protein [Hymenobacter sp. AT01-02]
MVIRYCILFALLLSAEGVYAQQANTGSGADAQTNLNSLAAGSAAVLPRGESYGMVGSPYVDNRWLPARLHMTNKVPLAPVPLKYDVLNRRLLMLPVNRPNDSLQLNDRLVAGFDLEEPAGIAGPARQRIFRRFSEAPSPELRSDFVEVIHEGNYVLLKRYEKVLKKANYQGAYSSGERSDIVEDKTTYYLRRPDATVVPVKLTMKALQAAAPELAGNLKAASGASTAKSDKEWAAVLAVVDKK